MIRSRVGIAGPSVPLPFILVAVAAGCFVVASAACAAAPPPAGAGGRRPEELRKDRLATARELLKSATETYKSGIGTYDEVREASRLAFETELDLCDSAKERVAALEKRVEELKEQEREASRLSKTGVSPVRMALKARLERLQAEAALERARGEAAPRAGGGDDRGLDEGLALAEMEVTLKQSAAKVAEARKARAEAALPVLRAQAAEAHAAEAFAEKQLKRFEELANLKAIEDSLVDERRAQLGTARARRVAADRRVVQQETQVVLEQARLEFARLEVGAASLRLKQLRARSGPKR